MNSELYLNIELDDSFEVPEQFFKKELVINTFDDFVGYLVIFDYWMLDKYPNDLYDWIFNNKDKINMDLLKEQFPMNPLINEIIEIIDTPDDKLCGKFSSIGNLSLLKYAHENGFGWDEETCCGAASSGHLDCLMYAHVNRCSWNYKTCSNASANGHLECLKYAHENGCDWNCSTCINASAQGHLECLKYAHENGCLWYSLTCINASIWAIKSKYKTFLKNVKVGDKLWFVKNKEKGDVYNGKIIAVVDFVSKNERVIGPLLSTTPNNDDLGWDEKGGHCDIELHYNNLYNLTDCNLFTGQKGQSTLCHYDNIKEKLLVNLIIEYEYISKYSKVTKIM